MENGIDKFDLSVWRTTQERIDMVQDPDCPVHILEIVIEHDMDKDVVLATLTAKNITVELIEKMCKIHGYSREDIERTRNSMISQKADVKINSFCGVPWNHASTSADGKIRMCCQMINAEGKPGSENYGILFKDDGSILTTNDDISKNRNAPAWKTIRKEMLDGVKPDICKLCWDEEDNGIGSRRQWTVKVFPDLLGKARKLTEPDGSINNVDFPIEHWDLRFGNKCNLACRSCGPTDSDLWYKDWVAMSGRTTFQNRGTKDIEIIVDDAGRASVKDSPFEWPDKTSLLSYIKSNISTVKRFYFTGGEPTINHTHRTLLQYIIDNGHANNIVLDYNTNMAGIPSKIFDQWKHFKEVNLGMSIDGIFEHFEYIRHPGKWETAYKNMCRIDQEPGFERLRASVTMTVSIMNVLHVLDMQWWMKEQGWNHIEPVIIVHNLYGPEHLNIQHLSKRMKKYITDRYQQYIVDIKTKWPDEIAWLYIVEKRLNGILTHMNGSAGNPAELTNFFENSKKLDNIRGEDWQTSLPEIYNMVEFCKRQEERNFNVKLATSGKK